MKKTLLALCLSAAALPVVAQAIDADLPAAADPLVWEPVAADGLTLAQFKWVARPIVVFADSPFDPAFVRQMELLEARANELAERDVVVIYDTDPDARSDIRTDLRPRGFSLVLISKDGQIAQRKPFPWDVREIGRAIDKMPIRKQELREAR